MELMHQLKERTRTLHDRVEQVAYSHQIMDGSLTLTQYKELILKNFYFHRLLEQAAEGLLSPAQQEALAWEKRQKCDLLLKDLKVLHLSPEDISFANAEPSFSIQSYEELIGALYVAEGSTLGGAVIRRRLNANPQIGDIPMHFYGCYGELTGKMWKEFMQVALQAGDTPEKMEQVVAKGVEAFELIEQIMACAVVNLLEEPVVDGSIS